MDCEKEKSLVTIPALVVDIQNRRGKGRCAGAFWNSRVIKVAEFGVTLALWVSHILTQHHIRHRHRSNALQHLDLHTQTHSFSQALSTFLRYVGQ